jgi:hypothetical protein
MGLLLATFLGASSLQANFAPAAWQSEPLGKAANNNNEWYLFPDSSKNPRVLVKSGANRKLLTGGPPSWIESAAVNMGLAAQGTFVADGAGGGFLIAAPGGANSQTLRMAIFQSDGSSNVEAIDTVLGNYTGISAELDSTGKLHVGYVWNNATICYARRESPTNWNIAIETLPSTSIQDTAVVPVSFNSVALYYCATASSTRTLWRCTPKVHPRSGTLLISYPALAASGAFPALPENRREAMENNVGQTIRGSRVGLSGRVYYFGSDGTSSWKFRRYSNDSAPEDEPLTLEVAGNVIPKSIRVAFGPDGNQRVAWYNETNKRIHYLRPVAANVDVPALGGYPVVTTGLQTNSDLLGLHFGPDGTPYLLYRTTLSAGFIAFPNDHFDTNGNGRPQILDTAFNSNSAGLEVLPVKATFPGVANSANRFKIRFPTIGNAITNGVGGIQTAAENLLYTVEVSSDLGTWTPLSPGSAITYTNTAISGSVRTYVGVINDPAPGPFPTRFARLNVSRLNYPY